MLRLRDFRRTTQPRDPNTRQFSLVIVRKSFQIEPELSGVIGILDRGPEPCIGGRPGGRRGGRLPRRGRCRLGRHNRGVEPALQGQTKIAR